MAAALPMMLFSTARFISGGFRHNLRRSCGAALGMSHTARYLSSHGGVDHDVGVKRKVSMVKGDGIGPEISSSVVQVSEELKIPIEWEFIDIFPVVEKNTTTIPRNSEDSIRRNKICLKGPLQTPIGGGHVSMNLILRKKFDLFANIRAARTIKGVATKFDNVDIIVIRENTEGEYSGLEHVVSDGIVQSIKVITEIASRKCVTFAFEVAKKNFRKRVILVHKATIQRMSDGLFLDTGRKVSENYPDIEFSDLNVDTACLAIVQYPEQFSDSVMVMPNLYGDILTDLCSGLIGGLGLTGSGNIGSEIAIFESVHGSAPDIAGKGLANPTALLLSFTLLLRHIHLQSYADRLESAILETLAEGKVVTRDIGGTASRTEYTNEIISHLK